MFAVLLAAVAGLPPFPGFWAKWHLVMNLAVSENHVWIAAVLLGSLLEAAYLFRWFGRIAQARTDTEAPAFEICKSLPPIGAAILVTVSGLFVAGLAGISQAWVFLPLAAGFVVWLVDFLPGRIKCAARTRPGRGRRPLADRRI